MVITRFAPSPSGHLHLGSARTALFNWLLAKNNGGKFLLRIEDTDKERSKNQHIEDIINSLSWLGIDYDDNITYQSKRTDRYKDVIQQLLDNDSAYYCDCSSEELDQMRKEQQSKGLKPKYDGRNRNKELKYKKGNVIRFKTPQEGSIEFSDTLKGIISIDNKELDDLIIARSDGSPTYNLCVVVDDMDMGITHIIRGDDHVNNTPRQIHILNSLGYKLPTYSHLPLIMGSDGKKLSKRHGAVSVYDYRADGILPQAFINYLSRLGWGAGNKEKFLTEELISLFTVDGFNKSAANFDIKKLHSVNKYFMKELEIDDIYKEFRHLTSDYDYLGDEKIYQIINILRGRVKTVKEIIDNCVFLIDSDFDTPSNLRNKFFIKENLLLYGLIKDKILRISEWEQENIKLMIDSALDELSIEMPKFAQPIRVGLTGTTSSPSIDIIIFLLGKDECIKRINNVIESIA